jgi:hypothetical protein
LSLSCGGNNLHTFTIEKKAPKRRGMFNLKYNINILIYVLKVPIFPTSRENINFIKLIYNNNVDPSKEH